MSDRPAGWAGGCQQEMADHPHFSFSGLVSIIGKGEGRLKAKKNWRYGPGPGGPSAKLFLTLTHEP